MKQTYFRKIKFIISFLYQYKDLKHSNIKKVISFRIDETAFIIIENENEDFWSHIIINNFNFQFLFYFESKYWKNYIIKQAKI